MGRIPKGFGKGIMALCLWGAPTSIAFTASQIRSLEVGDNPFAAAHFYLLHKVALPHYHLFSAQVQWEPVPLDADPIVLKFHLLE